MLAYFPNPFELAEACLVLLIFAATILVGAAAGGRTRFAPFDPLVGWAVLSLPFVLLGTLTTISFIWIDGFCLAVVAASGFVCAWRRVNINWESWLPYTLLALPFLLMVAPTDAYGWDQLSHWLPNTEYIAAHQHFPREGLPRIASMHAGYPYGFALAIYWVETLARLVSVPVKAVGTAAAINVVLFAIAARMLVEKARARAPNLSDKDIPLGKLLFGENIWLAAGLALLAMTVLSPTFLPTNSLSASADNPTSIVLLAIAFAVAPARVERSSNPVQLGLLLVLAVYLKEDNAVPALALLAGRVAWDARSGQKPLGTLRDLAVTALPMLAVAALWHAYVYFHIPQGEMTLRAPSAWRLDLLPRVLLGMAGILVSKIGYFVCVATTLFLAARALWRKSTGQLANSFSVIAAAGFIGYAAFLAFAYIGIFAEGEAERQAAFWRYQTHLGLVVECAVVLFVCGMAVRPRPSYSRLAVPVAAVMLLAPAIMAPVIRPDLDPQTQALRSIGVAVNARVAGANAIAVVDQTGNGAPCPMFVYEAERPLKVTQCVTKISPCKECMIQKAAAAQEFIWANGWSPELSQATRLRLAANGAYLLQHSDGVWTVVASWPKVPTKIRGVRAIWQET